MFHFSDNLTNSGLKIAYISIIVFKSGRLADREKFYEDK